MDGTNRFMMCPAHLYWVTFVSALKNRFLSSLEEWKVKNQIDAEKYSGDIEDYIVKMKRLNNLVGMSGVTLRTTIERQLLKDLRQRISLMSSTKLDDEWIQRVVKAGKMEELFLAEEKLSRGHQEKLQEKMGNPVKGKEIATHSSSRGGGGEFNVGYKQRFSKPKKLISLTASDIEECKRRLGGMSDETLRERRTARVCLRCGAKDHSQ
jgi:hypothetical protein